MERLLFLAKIEQGIAQADAGKTVSHERGYLDVFREVGAQFIEPSCGACINAGPGVSYDKDTVTISAINRNLSGRPGPGQWYLASPYTTAASAVAGYITAWEPSSVTAEV